MRSVFFEVVIDVLVGVLRTRPWGVLLTFVWEGILKESVT